MKAAIQAIHEDGDGPLREIDSGEEEETRRKKGDTPPVVIGTITPLKKSDIGELSCLQNQAPLLLQAPVQHPAWL